VISPRLKSEIRIQAHLRRCSAAGAFGIIAKKGNIDAGAIAIKVLNGDRLAAVYVESYDDYGNHVWRSHFDELVSERIADDYLAKEVEFDRDLWIVEIEDKQGRNFLD